EEGELGGETLKSGGISADAAGNQAETGGGETDAIDQRAGIDIRPAFISTRIFTESRVGEAFLPRQGVIATVESRGRVGIHAVEEGDAPRQIAAARGPDRDVGTDFRTRQALGVATLGREPGEVGLHQGRGAFSPVPSIPGMEGGEGDG